MQLTTTTTTTYFHDWIQTLSLKRFAYPLIKSWPLLIGYSAQNSFDKIIRRYFHFYFVIDDLLATFYDRRTAVVALLQRSPRMREIGIRPTVWTCPSR